MDQEAISTSRAWERDPEAALRREGVRGYPLAILTAILGLLLRAVFAPLLGTSNPYHTAWVAVVVAAWFCGVGPAILATVMSLLGVWYWFVPPVHSFVLADPKSDISGMIGFVIFSAFIIALGEANRRSRERSELEIRDRIQTEQKLRARERDLEMLHAEMADRVRERTAELNVAVDGLRQLSARLLQAQDDERRRLARELHDSVGQLLAALSMNISGVLSTPLNAAAAAAMQENAKLVEQISTEITNDVSFAASAIAR